MKETFTVKRLSELMGVTCQTIRRYSELGIIQPRRDDENGYRLYHATDLTLLLRLKGLLKMGFSTQRSCRVYESDIDETQRLFEQQERESLEELRRMEKRFSLLREQHERLRHWRRLSENGAELCVKPASFVVFYRDGASLMDDQRLEGRMRAIAELTPPMRSCFLFKKENVERRVDEYRMGMFAWEEELPERGVDIQASVRYPSANCLLIPIQGIGALNAPRPGSEFSEAFYVIERVNDVLAREGCALDGDVMVEVRHVCKQVGRAGDKPVVTSYSVAWVPVKKKE